MSDYITLLGAEDVQRAGRAMQSAAEAMQRAAGQIEEAMRLHALSLSEQLDRFEALVERLEAAACRP